MKKIIYTSFILGITTNLVAQTSDVEVYIAARNNAQIGGLNFTNGDIIKYNITQDVANLIFDENNFRKNNGTNGQNETLAALHILQNGNIILSTSGSAKLGVNQLSFDKDDLVEYNPVSDSAFLFFDGNNFRKNNGTTGQNENIDAFFLMDNGHLVLSTTGDAILGSNLVSFTKGDLVKYDSVADTAFLLLDSQNLFRASNGNLNGNGDIDGLCFLNNGNILMSFKDSEWIGTNLIQIADGDIVDYNPFLDTAAIYLNENDFSNNEDVAGLHTFSNLASDVDQDGIADSDEDYPNDASKAFNNFTPSENEYGTLAFEDQWPFKGDYDFNDVVIDYNINQITNANNDVVEIEAQFVLRAYGAGFKNGFGFQLPIPFDAVSNVTGQELTENYINLLGTNVEANQSKAVIIVFDNGKNSFNTSGFINTVQNSPFTTPDTFNIVVELSSPVNTNILGTPPYNPFIIVNKSRGYEVHLPDYSPTDVVDFNIFGLGDDDSNLLTNRFYRTDLNLPWAINLSEKWNYPQETVTIIQSHLKFASWVNSSGLLFEDWYKDLVGYRNIYNIYYPPQN